MKKFVKFLFAGIVFIKNDFAMEDQPLIQMQTPKSFTTSQKLEAGQFGSYIVIALPIKQLKITSDRKALIEQRHHCYNNDIFSQGQFV